MLLAVLFVSVGLQLAALVLAIRVLRNVPRPIGQALILTTLALMALQRGVPLVLALRGETVALGFPAEIFALVISGLSVAAVVALGRVLEDRRQAEIALQESEQRLRLALDAGDFGVIEVLPHDQVWADPRALELLDLDGLPVTRTALLERIHPDDRAIVERGTEGADPHGRFEIEYRVLGNREVRWLRTIGRVQPDGRRIGITRDVTHLKRSELAVSESEQRYRLLADNADDIISLHDLQGRLLYASPSAQRMTGFRLEHLLGVSADTLVHPDDRQRVRREARRSLRRRQATIIEWRRLRPDGSFLWSETSTKVLLDANGRPERLLCVTRDITARRQSEEALRRSEQLYRSIVETAHEGIWLLDPEERTRFANSRMAEILGCTPEEMTDALAHGFLDEADRQSVAGNVERRRQGIAEQLELTFVRKDGTRVPTLVSTSPVFDEAGRFAGSLAMIVDISRRKEHEQELQAALSAQATLLKEIHHRVKNNLAVVVNLLMLQGARTEDPEAKGILRECQDRVHTMSLIHESLYRSGGEATLALAPFLSRLCDYLYQSHALDRDRVRVEVETDDLYVDLDLATPLGLLLNELLSNALKHAFPGRRHGRVRVELRRGGNQAAWLLVQDDGVGLREDIDVLAATSLGLKLVRTLARQLDGELQVGRDGGTEFRLTFPLPAADA